MLPIALTGVERRHSRQAQARVISNGITLVLAIVGAADSLLLTIHHYAPTTSLPCGSGPAGCAGALTSDYSHVGPIPTALLGLAMYATIAWLCIKRLPHLAAMRVPAGEGGAGNAGSEPSPESGGAAPSRQPSALAATPRELSRLNTAVFALALTAAAISWWLQYTSLFVLYSFCPWCFTSAVTITLVAALAAWDHFVAGRLLTGEQKLVTGVCAFLVVMLAFVYWPAVAIQWRVAHIAGAPFAMRTAPTLHKLLAPPGMHMEGNPQAPYLVVEFADYMCPNCREATGVIRSVLASHRDKVRFAFRNRPLQDHPWARLAADAAEAAGLQGDSKFWAMHDYLYDHQADMEDPSFTATTFEKWAANAGLNVEQFKQDWTSRKVFDIVGRDVAAADSANIHTTPTFCLFSPKHPDLIWEFSGASNLEQLMNDPKARIWR